MTERAMHPGEVLQDEFMVPLGLSANRLGSALGVPANRISEIVRGRRGMTADTALRLARYFGTEASFWLTLQTEYDIAVAELLDGERIRREVEAKGGAEPAS